MAYEGYSLQLRIMEYETKVSAESNQKTSESDVEETSPGTYYNAQYLSFYKILTCMACHSII